MAQAGRELVLREFGVANLVNATQTLYLQALRVKVGGLGPQRFSIAEVRSKP
jgi:hypothetical protein